MGQWRRGPVSLCQSQGWRTGGRQATVLGNYVFVPGLYAWRAGRREGACSVLWPAWPRSQQCGGLGCPGGQRIIRSRGPLCWDTGPKPGFPRSFSEPCFLESFLSFPPCPAPAVGWEQQPGTGSHGLLPTAFSPATSVLLWGVPGRVSAQGRDQLVFAPALRTVCCEHSAFKK